MQNPKTNLIADGSEVYYVACAKTNNTLGFDCYPKWVMQLMKDRCVTFGAKAIEVDIDMDNYLSLRPTDVLVKHQDGSLAKYSRTNFNKLFKKDKDAK